MLCFVNLYNVYSNSTTKVQNLHFFEQNFQKKVQILHILDAYQTLQHANFVPN